MNAVKRINVPASLSPQSIVAFEAAIREAIAAEPRAVVLEHRGDVFCTGMDLNFQPLSDAPGKLAMFVGCLRALRESGAITVAIVDGSAFGGGVGLASACDLVIATRRASFGMPELLYGLIPAVIMPFLLERVSPQKLRLADLAARTFTADEALQFGFADVVVEDPEAELRSWLRRFSRVQPDAVKMLKQYTAPQRLEVGLEVTARTFTDPRVVRRIQTFLSSGTAPWMQDDHE